MAKKKTPKIRQKAYGRTAYDQKKSPKIIDLQGLFQKKSNFEKKSQNMLFLRAFKPKKKIYICYVALLTLRLVGDPGTHGPLAPTDHSTRTILGFWICIFFTIFRKLHFFVFSACSFPFFALPQRPAG